MPKKNLQNKENPLPENRGKTKKPSIKQLKEFIANLDLKDNEKVYELVIKRKKETRKLEILTETAPDFLQKMDLYPIEALRCCFQKLVHRAHPTKRRTLGIGEAACVDVSDAEMSSFKKAFRQATQKGSWRMKSGKCTLYENDGERKIKRILLETESREDVKKILGAFSGEAGDKFKRVLEQHYFSYKFLDENNKLHKRVDYIDTSNMDVESGGDWLGCKMDFCKKNGMDTDFPIEIISARIILGPFVRPERVGPKGKVYIGNENAIAKFTIEYRKDVDEINGKGQLLVSCHYETFKGGFAHGN